MKNSLIEQAKQSTRDIGTFGRDSSMAADRVVECLTSALHTCEEEGEKNEIIEVAQKALEEASQRHLLADTLADTRDADSAMRTLVEFIKSKNLTVNHYMVTASRNTAFNQMMNLSRIARDQTIQRVM